MKRLEIIANHSVQSEITSLFDILFPELGYTLMPAVLGKGRSGNRRGDSVWPETNFCVFTYCSEEQADTLTKAVSSVKESFPREGIKLFMI